MQNLMQHLHLKIFVLHARVVRIIKQRVMYGN